MNELKPCPFCGNKMEGCPDYTISFKRDKRKIFGVYHEICTLHCNRCGCTIRQAGASKEEAERNAVNAWNKRADMLDVQLAYYKGLNDGIEQCTERLKRLTDEMRRQND